MSAYSSSLRKSLIRKNSAVRSEFNDSLLRDSGRADNRLNEQYKELERARRVVEADLRKQKKVVMATHTPARRSSCPAIRHSRLQARLVAEKTSADERLNNFLTQNHKTDPTPERRGHKSEAVARRRAQTESHLHTVSKTRDKSPVNHYRKQSDIKNNEGEIENEVSKPPRRKNREAFFKDLSKPKHPVQDKKSIRSKIEQDMEKTRKTERRLSKPSNDYLQGDY